MKFLDEYRDAAAVERAARALRAAVTRPWTIMEVCGGQTHSILKVGIPDLLPPEITLLHGPGCPVCVTPVALIDAAVEIASRPGTLFCSFGDMLRVPGSGRSLLEAKAAGADVRAVYSPLDAVNFARAYPLREVVFFAVGFETTAPANARAVWQAARDGLSNFSLLVAHVLVPPALRAILGAPDRAVQGLLAPGHVCTITGWGDYEPLAREYAIPIVVTGFEPLDILQGIRMTVAQLETRRAEVENQYSRAVSRDGNRLAKAAGSTVFQVCGREWRGIGNIPASGLELRPDYLRFDALRRFGLQPECGRENAACMAGLVLQGRCKPVDCPAFGAPCTPESPLGAPMVSSEGACAAYYQWSR